MEKYTVTPADEKRVKGLGFLRNKGTDCFNGRVITRNGKITAREMKCIAEAAEKYASGSVAMTTRLTVEVIGIPYENIDAFCAHLAKEGLTTGGTGPKVRPIVSCKGTTCQYGLIDTYALSETIHHRFYEGYHEVTLPHKFKIAVGGCPNNCVKPDLNDLGIIGQRPPVFRREACRGCKKCLIEATCPMKAAKQGEDGILTIDERICTRCGRCAGKCPFHAMEESAFGYKVTVGGRWGKKGAQGLALGKLFTSEEEVLSAVEKAILFFRKNGMPGERFADTIRRVGFEKAEREILSDEILSRKDAILAKEIGK